MKRAVKRLTPLILGLLLLAGKHFAGAAQVKEPSPEGVEFFEKKVRPILANRCYQCHSLQAKPLKGGLLLDSREGVLNGGAHGRVIVPGSPDKSLLIQAVRYQDDDLQMPPHNPLAPEEVSALEAWIKMGAPDPRNEPPRKKEPPASENTQLYGVEMNQARGFWSFQPVKDPPVPTVKNASWSRRPVDQFILAKLEAKGLAAGPEADKRALIRRATFDLIGLPPAAEEVETFLKDKSLNAFEKLVDRLLSSPHYGERWGRHWLDLVRYADTSGCNSDFPVPSAYRYRNYVIQSFNQDKPYDQFVREQIAGDLLPAENGSEREDKIVATGYLAISRRFGSRAAEFHLTLEDTIDNVGKTVLGLSVSCARCHNHKFDPIPTSDYYALYGIFNSIRYAFPGTEIYRHTKDFVPLGPVDEAIKLSKWEAALAELDDRIEKLNQERRLLEIKAKEAQKLKPKDAETPGLKEARDEKRGDTAAIRTLEQVKIELAEAKTRVEELESKSPAVQKAYAVSEGKVGNAKIQIKGDPRTLGAEVPRGFLQILGGQQLPKGEKGSGRRELAQWLTDTKNPLTARVMANRIWQRHFGKGIVQTPNDFGARGKPPTHPELLDYLAARFVESGWSIKSMHRLIMLSRTYQLAGTDSPRNAAIDVNNDLLWRFNRRRLDAEEIRDAMLAVSGALDPGMGGGHPFPPEQEWRYTQHRPFVASYETNRRSVYLMQQRIRKQPFLEIFDGADSNATTAERAISTTPIQALFMMNAPFAHEQADRFAVRVGMAYSEEDKRIDYAHRLAFGRPATRGEIRMGKAYLKQIREDLKETVMPADQRVRAALASYARVLLSSNEFMFID